MEVGLNFWSDKEGHWVQTNYYREKLWKSLQSLNTFDDNVDDFIAELLDTGEVVGPIDERLGGN